MPHSDCKPHALCCQGSTRRRFGRAGRALMLAASCAGLAGLLACRAHATPRLVTVQALEQAPAAPRAATERVVVVDPAELAGIYHALNGRLGFVQVRTAGEWARLVRAAPALRARPDFARGTMVGLVSRAGTRPDGQWPIHVEHVRVHDGGGLLVGRFEPGTYFPDGATYLETTYVADLAAVLIVDVNGVRFYPN